MDNNKNDDLLKVENYEQNEYVVASSIVEPPIEKTAKAEKKVTLLNVLVSAVTLNKKKSDSTYTALRPIKTLKFVIVIAVITLLLFLMSKFADAKLFIPALVLFASFAIPMLLVILHYELNPKKNISIFQLFCSFLFGMLLYIAINSVSNTLLVRSVYKSTIDIFLVPVFWGFGELFFVSLLAKMYNITDLSSNILLAVCIGMGYAFVTALYSLYSGLFVSVQILIGEAEHYAGSAIVDNSVYFAESVDQVLKLIPWNCIAFPFFLACWSIVMGNVVSLTEMFGKKRAENPFSVYLLLILVIVLYILLFFPVSFGYFEYLLKILCAVLSVFIALKLENNALTESVKSLNEM